MSNVSNVPGLDRPDGIHTCYEGHGCAPDNPPAPAKKRGRPPKTKPDSSTAEQGTLNPQVEGSNPSPAAKEPKPPGAITRFVADDGKTLDLDGWEEILAAFLKHRCSLPRTAKELKIPLGTLRRWAKDDAFKEALDGVRQIVADEVLSQYVEKALDPLERNPAWKIFFLKKNVAAYADKVGKVEPKIEIVIQDKTFDKKVSA